ncbi:MAG TPA: hypothetical protein VG317_10455 [Pseudonocardiaceae bacterium]|jgi:hypothetical protein|nr:hypothetical protein [Pseudonocardiaceae bacterium]
MPAGAAVRRALGRFEPVDAAMPGWQVIGESTVRPRRANLLLMLRR